MTSGTSLGPKAIAQHAVIRPIGLDDWSAVRHLHVVALDRLADQMGAREASGGIKDHVASPEYTDTLWSANLSVALVDGHLVGTCGWVPGDDHGAAARITGLIVDPLFAKLGIGRRLVGDAEARARTAGYRVTTTRATENTIGYFLALGYEIASQGIVTVVPDFVLPVVFMRKRDAGDSKPAAPNGRNQIDPAAEDRDNDESLTLTESEH